MAQLQRELGTYARGEVCHIHGSFKTNGSSAPDTFRDGHSAIIKSVTRVSAGLYEIVLDDGFSIPELPTHKLVSWQPASATPTKIMSMGVVGATWSQANRKFRIVAVKGLATTATTYTTGVAVTSNVVTLPNAGPVLMAEATTATSAGVKTIQSTASPAAGKVQVTYTAGVPTLTFNATDSVTAATVLQLVQGAVDDPDSGDRVNFDIYGSINSVGTDLA